MVPGDVPESGAACKGHGKLQFILKHLDHASYSMLPIRRKAINHRPSNLFIIEQREVETKVQ